MTGDKGKRRDGGPVGLPDDRPTGKSRTDAMRAPPKFALANPAAAPTARRTPPEGLGALTEAGSGGGDGTRVQAEPLAFARLWALAKLFARPMPRAGAWYPVVGEASGGRIVLVVMGKRVACPRKLFEIRPERPTVFTVVVRTHEVAERVSAARGSTIDRVYAVCPACTERLHLLQRQPMLTCTECGHHGEVAWWESG